jgi:hypothetical protein
LQVPILQALILQAPILQATILQAPILQVLILQAPILQVRKVSSNRHLNGRHGFAASDRWILRWSSLQAAVPQP